MEESDQSEHNADAQDILADLVVPNSYAVLGTRTGTGPRMGKQPAIRRLSNMDESELRFRDHRDSVTLAWSRIVAGSMSPDSSMHRNPVSIAKKRKHVRNHAISNVSDMANPKAIASEPSSPTIDLTCLSQMPPLSTVKSHATRALKSSSSTSMLKPSASKRHIRIME